MAPIHTDKETSKLLPANYLFWRKWDEDDVSIKMNDVFFEATAYHTTRHHPHSFYKPVSRVFPISDLYERE